MEKMMIVAALVCSCFCPALVQGQNEPRIVVVGQEFTFTLESNPSTGYQWQLARPLDEAIIMLIRSEYQQPESKLLGAPGKEVWTFKGMGPGKATIDLNYVRPWEKNIPPVASRSFAIQVRD
ncbi:MAG: protease inhibitor I42 family protein [Deltaproteobacteria bacterium]|nr:protease inhibitor I42 family protein [Deltaproteobacteria bacterium]